MSTEVWVRWKDSTTGEWLFDTISELKNDAQIKDLRKAFVKQQQYLGVPPAAIQVRETEDSETLRPSTILTNYFTPPADSAAVPGPGKSEHTALLLTMPKGPQQSSRKRVSDEQGKNRRADVNVTFVNFSEMDAGKPWRKLTYGCDFLSDAKDFIIRSWELESTPDNLHLACYVAGVPARVEFDEASGYWRLDPSSNLIYFWVGSKENSPPRPIEFLQNRVDRMEGEVKRLKTTSGTAKDQIERWNQRSDLGIEDLEAAFPAIHTDDDATAKELVANGPQGNEESNVQDMWNSAMPSLVENWKDCRSPNGIPFDGRRHDIDLVLLTRDVVSVLYLDTPIELKDTIATDAKRREVVLQLLDRFGATFDGQPSRKECWGLGMDGRFVLFVKCTRSMSYSVSPNCDLHGSGWDFLLRFLKSPSELRGYIQEDLPVLFGITPLALLGRNVYLLDEDTVCKVGQEGEIKHENSMLSEVAKVPFMMAPAAVNGQPRSLALGDSRWCFRMSRCNVLSVNSEEDVVNVASSVFWRLGVLHEIGIVHKDVKPSNILSSPKLGGQMNYLLGDYGAAEHWKTGDSTSGTATDAFSSVPGEFHGTYTCMRRRDLESLFWSVFSLWLQVLKSREAPGRFRVSQRVDLSVLRDRGGSFVGDNDDVVFVPHNAVLREYLVGQAKSRRLHLPFEVFRSLFEKKMSSEVFNSKASRNGYLPCPPEIFEWISTKTSNGA